MSDNTGIEWTDATWNPVVGCTKVTPGCDHCYAKTMHERFNGPGSFDTVSLRPGRLDQPLRWRKPRKVFVNSMSDLFHQDVPDEYIAQVFHVMRMASRHSFQVLTKRHARMRALMNSERFREMVWTLGGVGSERPAFSHYRTWPAPNIWLGVSVENQQWADIRIPALMETSAAVRFLSCEPLLGPVRLCHCVHPAAGGDGPEMDCPLHGMDRVDWVIVGGESGPGARPMYSEWARSLRDQCVESETPFLFKQWGEWLPGPLAAGWKTDPREHWGEIVNDGVHPDVTWRRTYQRVGKKAAGRILDGRTWDEYPQAVTA